METTTSITFDNNEIFRSIEKLSPKNGDVLIFSIATDENGDAYVDMESVRQVANVLSDELEEKGVRTLFLLDKIYLFSQDEAERTIKTLQNYISYIQKAAGLTGDIENRKVGEEKIVIDTAVATKGIS